MQGKEALLVSSKKWAASLPSTVLPPVWWRVLAALQHPIPTMPSQALMYMASLVVGTVPAVIVGLLFRTRIEILYHSPLIAAGGLLLTAAILFGTRFAGEPQALPAPWVPHPPGSRS